MDVSERLLQFIFNTNSSVQRFEIESSFCLGINLFGQYFFCFLLQQAACSLFHICNEEIINKITLGYFKAICGMILVLSLFFRLFIRQQLQCDFLGEFHSAYSFITF